MLGCFAYSKEQNQNINYQVTFLHLQYHYHHKWMTGIKKQRRSKMSPQINPQSFLSDLV